MQFLSEPSGGSTWPPLTRAERDGEVFRLNGSKIWSTGAHFSDYCMVLARTNVDVPKHGGLSMFMMPIRSRGVTVTPIKLVTGGSHFGQDFFDDVQLDPSQLIGGENDGWRVASKLLFHERNMIGGNSLNDHAASGRTRRPGTPWRARRAGQGGRPQPRRQLHPAAHRRGGDPPDAGRADHQPDQRPAPSGPHAGVSGLDPAADGRADRLPPQADRDGGRGHPGGHARCSMTRGRPTASAGSRPGSVRSAAAARRCSATASASASWDCPRGHPRPGRAVQRGAGQPPPARLRKGGLMTDEARAPCPALAAAQ